MCLVKPGGRRIILFDAVDRFDRGRVRYLRDRRTGFHRLDRPILEHGFDKLQLALVRAGFYADHHLGRPLATFRDLDEQIVETVLDPAPMPALMRGTLGLSVVRRMYSAWERRQR